VLVCFFGSFCFPFFFWLSAPPPARMCPEVRLFPERTAVFADRGAHLGFPSPITVFGCWARATPPVFFETPPRARASGLGTQTGGGGGGGDRAPGAPSRGYLPRGPPVPVTLGGPAGAAGPAVDGGGPLLWGAGGAPEKGFQSTLRGPGTNLSLGGRAVRPPTGQIGGPDTPILYSLAGWGGGPGRAWERSRGAPGCSAATGAGLRRTKTQRGRKIPGAAPSSGLGFFMNGQKGARFLGKDREDTLTAFGGESSNRRNPDPRGPGFTSPLSLAGATGRGGLGAPGLLNPSGGPGLLHFRRRGRAIGANPANLRWAGRSFGPGFGVRCRGRILGCRDEGQLVFHSPINRRGIGTQGHHPLRPFGPPPGGPFGLIQ